MPKPLITAARAALLILDDLASRIVRDGVPIKTAARDLAAAIEEMERSVAPGPISDIEFAKLVTVRMRSVGLAGTEIVRASALCADLSEYLAHRCDDRKVIRGAVFNLLATMQHVDQNYPEVTA